MKNKKPIFTAGNVFGFINATFLLLVASTCFLPLLHVFSISLSSANAATRGAVTLWPVEFSTAAYRFVLNNDAFWVSMWVSVKRIVLAAIISLTLTILAAYPLSRDGHSYPKRKYLAWIFFFTMLFNGGLVPSFLIVTYTGLIDTIWALVIPGAVSVWHLVLMLNFFRQIPKELDEAAFIDGADHFTVLFKIYLPLSKASIATILLFTVVGHWNAWFDGVLYMNSPKNWPLQTYLQSIIVATDDVTRELLKSNIDALKNRTTPQTLKAAQIFVGTFPILVVYPFLQKHFTKGIMLGSVKG